MQHNCSWDIVVITKNQTQTRLIGRGLLLWSRWQKALQSPRKTCDGRALELPKITAHAISKCHHGGHCVGCLIWGHLIQGIASYHTRVLCILSHVTCARKLKDHIKPQFHRTTCDFNLMFWRNVLIRQFVADLCVKHWSEKKMSFSTPVVEHCKEA